MLFANMSQVTDGILTDILNFNPKITRKLVIDHTKDIVNTYYTTPVVTLLSDNNNDIPSTTYVVNGFVTKAFINEPVSIKTAVITNHIVINPGFTESNVKQKSLMLENEYKVFINECVTKKPVTNKLVNVKTEKVGLAYSVQLGVAKKPKFKLNNRIHRDRNRINCNKNRTKSDKNKISNNTNSNINRINSNERIGIITNANTEDASENKQLIDQINNQTVVSKAVINKPATIKTEVIGNHIVITPNIISIQTLINKSSTSELVSNELVKNKLAKNEHVTNEPVTVKSEIDQDVIELSEVIKEEPESESESDESMDSIRNVAYVYESDGEGDFVLNKQENLEQISSDVANVQKKEIIFRRSFKKQ